MYDYFWSDLLEKFAPIKNRYTYDLQLGKSMRLGCVTHSIVPPSGHESSAEDHFSCSWYRCRVLWFIGIKSWDYEIIEEDYTPNPVLEHSTFPLAKSLFGTLMPYYLLLACFIWETGTGSSWPGFRESVWTTNGLWYLSSHQLNPLDVWCWCCHSFNPSHQRNTNETAHTWCWSQGRR